MRKRGERGALGGGKGCSDEKGEEDMLLLGNSSKRKGETQIRCYSWTCMYL